MIPVHYVPTDKINASVHIHIEQILKVIICTNANFDQLRHIY